MLLRSKLFLLSPAPIHTNTRGGDQNMQGIGCYALKISMIEKTPTPHHRKNAALPFGLCTRAIDLFGPTPPKMAQEWELS